MFFNYNTKQMQEELNSIGRFVEDHFENQRKRRKIFLREQFTKIILAILALVAGYFLKISLIIVIAIMWAVAESLKVVIDDQPDRIKYLEKEEIKKYKNL